LPAALLIKSKDNKNGQVEQDGLGGDQEIVIGEGHVGGSD